MGGDQHAIKPVFKPVYFKIEIFNLARPRNPGDLANILNTPSSSPSPSPQSVPANSAQPGQSAFAKPTQFFLILTISSRKSCDICSS
jgi:hypothetical protein